MPEVNISGPSGRLEGRYHPQKDEAAPVAIILHPHPKFGGTMNNKIVQCSISVYRSVNQWMSTRLTLRHSQ